MLSTENRVVLACGVVALALGYGVSAFTDLPTWVGIGVLLVVGVMLPQVVTGRLERSG